VNDAGKLADTAFTGVQTERLMEILTGISMGTTSPEAAKLVILEAFPAIDPGIVDRMIAASLKFKPKPKVDVPNA
jgi:hypothetical protein